MKYSAGKGRHKESISGRKIIIAIVVVTSALSFTLGYFVGTSVLKEKHIQPPGIGAQQQAITIPPRQETAPAPQSQPPVANEQLPQDKTMPLKTVAVKEENNPVASSVKVGDLSVATRTETLREGEGGLSAKNKQKSLKNETLYTVQAGAFKNPKDALSLKHKLEKKGYKAYIKKSAEEKNAKLFKVRTGEFTDREKAEDFALKLKKSEGLKAAFVTAKNGETREEDKVSSPPRANKQEKPR
ncbi:MAG: SPOR domain-containing protein [Nitrospirae bacterium]|nr:SPOR domain-containing protein [Nitrospirota bacterium]